MSLYHEAAAVLDTVNKGKTSLKAEIFGKKTWKTDGKVLFALTSEAAKWSSILAEVVEKSGILKIEKQVCVLLSGWHRLLLLLLLYLLISNMFLLVKTVANACPRFDA